MTKQLVFRVLLSVGLVLCTSQLFAHHSVAATFKADSAITVEGVVTDFKFRNPHVMVFFDVTNADGTSTQWVAEGSSATSARRLGWTRDTLSAGSIVRVTGDTTYDGSPMIKLETAQLIDPDDRSIVQTFGPGNGASSAAIVETTFELENRPLTLTSGRPNLSGTWTGRTSHYPAPRNPDVPFNEAGLAQQANYDPASDPQVYCEPPGLIRQAGMTSYAVRIDQQADRVVIEYEEYGYTRTIYFDDRAAMGIHTHFGDSVARYEGEALIIETVNLLPDLATPEGNRLSDQTRVVETYKRVDEPGYGAMLLIETQISDPLLLDDKLVLTNIKVTAPAQEFIENECFPPMRERETVHPYMSFFLTSEGAGDGANLGGLEGADAHCTALAERVDQGHKDWKAYLSTTGEKSVNARDRVGQGPWYNAHGVPIGKDADQLHGDADAAEWLTRATALDERGREFYSKASTVQDDGINSRHDIITGTQLDGSAFDSDEDTTCENWTLSSGGRTVAGHADRRGGGPHPTSWIYAHPTYGCSADELARSDGDGLFYCFATGN